MTCQCTLGRDQCNCGLAAASAAPSAEEKRAASDFAELEGEQQRRVDWWANRLVPVVIAAIAFAAIFWPVKP